MRRDVDIGAKMHCEDLRAEPPPPQDEAEEEMQADILEDEQINKMMPLFGNAGVELPSAEVELPAARPAPSSSSLAAPDAAPPSAGPDDGSRDAWSSSDAERRAPR
eukprot:8394291-Pyramimonas_sp.AAC.1